MYKRNYLPSVYFIIPYFGPWPVWLPLFLESCRHNSGFNWLLFGDQKKPNYLPSNVRWQKMNLAEFNRLAQHETGLAFNIKTPYKICDARPMFGQIFNKYLKNASFWGHSDLDILYGDLNSFGIKKSLLSCDVYTPCDSIVGHFTLYRNVETINKLYLKLENLPQAYRHSPRSLGYDEKGMNAVLHRTKNVRFSQITDYKKELSKNRCAIGASIMHCGQVIRERLTAMEKYVWKDGKTFQLNGSRKREFMYLHFLTWKSESFWLKYNPSGKVLRQFYLDVSGFSLKSKLSIDKISRGIRLIQCVTKLVKRASKRVF